MTNPTITISPAEIREGDFLLREDGTAAWVALADAATVPDFIGDGPENWTAVPVEHADGGRGNRFWPEGTDVRLAIVDDLGARSLRLV